MSKQALTLDEIHQGTLEILKKIIAICDELQIDYFLAYGTLLGAVRHHGFIPWDDDLDLIMLRPAYDRFRAYCTEHEQELFPFRLMGRHNTPDYPYTIDRFCDLRYEMVSEDITDAGMGMFVDIYPYDGLGKDPEKALKRLSFRKWLYMNCLFSAVRQRFVSSHRGAIGSILKAPIHLLARIIGPKFFLDRMERMQYTYPLEESDYVACLVWEWPLYVRKKAHYEEFTYLDFEGLQVKVPKAYDEVLRISYGDYMQLPPEDKRVPHHEYALYRKPEFFGDGADETA